MITLLKFNKKYYQDIINGVKTQTLREHNKRFNPGEKVKAIFPGTTNECLLEITSTGYKQFKYIDEEDAKREGYPTKEELKHDLQKIYPRIDNFTRLYYYRFKIIQG